MAISVITGFDFGRIRLLSDIAMSAIALAICLFTLGNAAGVREGTLISALLIGNIVRFMIARYPIFQKKTLMLAKHISCLYNHRKGAHGEDGLMPPHLRFFV